MDAMHVNCGEKIDYTPAAAVAAGQIIQWTDGRAAFADSAIAASALGSLRFRGVALITKKATQALSKGQVAQWDDTNNQADIAGDFPVGVVLQDAAATDTQVYVLLNDFRVLNRAFVAKIAYTNVEAAAGTAKKIYDANCPQKLQVIDMWIICKDANAGTVKLTDGTNDITNALTHGTSDKAIVRVGTIDDAYWQIAVGGTLQAVPATGGAAEVYVLLMPVS